MKAKTKDLKVHLTKNQHGEWLATFRYPGGQSIRVVDTELPELTRIVETSLEADGLHAQWVSRW
jgi:hypothetical protein